MSEYSQLPKTVSSYYDVSQTRGILPPKMVVSVDPKKCIAQYSDIPSFKVELKKLVDVLTLMKHALVDASDKGGLFIQSLSNLKKVTDENLNILNSILSRISLPFSLPAKLVKQYCNVRKNMISEIRLVYKDDLVSAVKKGMLKMSHDNILRCWDFNEEPLCKQATGCDWQNNKCLDYWYWNQQSCDSYATQDDCSDMGCTWNAENNRCME